MSEQQDIEPGGAVGAPVVKFRTIGQTLIGALVDSETRQQYKWKNGQADGLAFKEDGKPALERVIHLLVLPGTTAMRSSDTHPSGYEQLEPGTLARVILKGFKWGQYIEVRKSMPGGRGEKTGDILTLTYTHGSMSHPRTGARIELLTEADIAAVPRDVIVGKDMSVQVQRPDAEHAAIIDACNAARAERKAQTITKDAGPGVADNDDRWLIGGNSASSATTMTVASQPAGAAAPPAPTGVIDQAVWASLNDAQRQALMNAAPDSSPPF